VVVGFTGQTLGFAGLEELKFISRGPCRIRSKGLMKALFVHEKQGFRAMVTEKNG